MALNHHGKKFIILANGGKQDTAVIYHSILTLENVGTVKNYKSIFIILAPGVNVLKLFNQYFMNVHYIRKDLLLKIFLHRHSQLQLFTKDTSKDD
jgi:hypothetical protein